MKVYWLWSRPNSEALWHAERFAASDATHRVHRAAFLERVSTGQMCTTFEDNRDQKPQDRPDQEMPTKLRLIDQGGERVIIPAGWCYWDIGGSVNFPKFVMATKPLVVIVEKRYQACLATHGTDFAGRTEDGRKVAFDIYNCEEDRR